MRESYRQREGVSIPSALDAEVLFTFANLGESLRFQLLTAGTQRSRKQR